MTRIAYITSGAAGMYCGSCMHDNSLARGLTKLGVDIQLIPTYTPIRTDEENVSVDRVFFGGINVFLQQKIPLFRYLPALFDRFLDRPKMLRWATSRGMKISAKELGSMTVSMLRGRSGYQRKEVRRLRDWLLRSARPDLINLSNMLIAGCVPALKEALGVPVLATLQGDDIFLDDLVEPYRSQALTELYRLQGSFDGFVVNSRYYAEYMSSYLRIPIEKFRIVPLGLDTHDFEQFLPRPELRHTELAETGSAPTQTIGYLARLAPEKGLHVLVERGAEVLTARAESTPLMVGSKGSAVDLTLSALTISSLDSRRPRLIAACTRTRKVSDVESIRTR